MIITNCSYCGKEVKVNPSRFNNRKNIFCSKECNSKYIIEHNPNYYKCEVCGKLTYKKPNKAKVYKHITCSRECLGKLRHEIYQGENNPNFGNFGSKSSLWMGDEVITDKGYVMVYKPDHPLCNAYGRIFEHRLNAESIATEEQKEYIEGVLVLRSDLDVHHVDMCKTNNNVDNLQILTRSEHAKIHAGLKRKYIFLKCENCGRDFEIQENRTKTAKFCSEKCYLEHKHKNSKLKVCKNCGDEFVGGDDRVCCSLKCSNELRNRGTLKTTCKNCGESFTIKKSRLDKAENVFCCKKCYNEFRNKQS